MARATLLWRVIRLSSVPLLVVGAIGAALHHRWGAYVLIADVVVQVFGLAAVSYRHHRQVMTRPWPKVAPLSDDDWDD